MKRILYFSQNRPYLTLISFLILFFVSIWGLKFSRFELDIYDVYDPNFPSSIDLKEMKEKYDDHTQILVHFQFDHLPKASEICRLMSWRQEITKSRSIKNATSLWSLRRAGLEGDSLWYKKVLDDPCKMPADSVIAFDADFSKSSFRHMVANTGTKDLVFDISFAEKKLDVSQIQKFIEQTDQFAGKNLSGLKVRYLGQAGFRYYFKKIMGQDQFSSLLVLLIVFVFLRLIYGTWRCGLYLVVTLIMANVILYGVIALVGAPIDILTNNLFLMITVASTADFIFVTQNQLTESYQKSWETQIAPCFFTTFTTMLGFISLNTSDIGLIKRFGNGAALGGLLEWMMMFMFLPALLKVLNKERIWVNPDKAIKSKWITKIEEYTLPRFALRILIVLMVLAVPSFFFLNDQDSPVENLPKHHVLREGYEDFARKFNWQGQVYLYFSESPSAVDYQQILTKTSAITNVYKIEYPEEITEEWVKDFPVLKQDLIKREVSTTPLWKKYYSSGSLRIPLYLKAQDLNALRNLRDEVNSICQDRCRLAGQRIVYLEYGEKISVTMIESFAVSIILVVLVLSYIMWITKKLIHFWPVILSSLMGPLVILSLVSIFQIQVTVITSIFLAIMVGLTGDNAIQYLMTEDEDLARGIEARARASIMVTIIMILSSGLFLVQILKPMRILGALFILGFFVNLVGDLFGLKGLLSKRSSASL